MVAYSCRREKAGRMTGKPEAEGTMKNKCCFTGHRNIRKEDAESVMARTREAVLRLIEKGVRSFYVGGATGYDMLAAELLIGLRDGEGQDIRVISALPYPEWREKWGPEEIRRQDIIMEKSDEVFYVCPEGGKGVFLTRDRRMVEESGYCIAYCTRRSGGTAYTVRYALKRGLEVVNTADWDVEQVRIQTDSNSA